MEGETNSLALAFSGVNNQSATSIFLTVEFSEYDEEAHRRLEKSISQAMYFCGLSEYELELPSVTLNVTKTKGDGLKFSHTTEDGDVITFGNPFLAVSRNL